MSRNETSFNAAELLEQIIGALTESREHALLRLQDALEESHRAGKQASLDRRLRRGDQVTFLKNGRMVLGTFQREENGIAVILRHHCITEMPIEQLKLKAKLVQA